MQISKFSKYYLAILSFICLCACQQDTLYFTYEPVPTDGWSKTDTLQFYLPDTLSPGTYHLEVGVRHSGKYPYRDLWLELTQYIPSPTSDDEWIESKDTIHVYLANEKGNWNGSGTTSGYFQHLSAAGEITIANKDAALNEDEQIKSEVNTKVTPSKAEVKKGVSYNSSTSKDKGNDPKQRKAQSKRKKYTFKGKGHTLGKQDKYHLKVTHIMTDSLLLHISDIGLRFTK